MGEKTKSRNVSHQNYGTPQKLRAKVDNLLVLCWKVLQGDNQTCRSSYFLAAPSPLITLPSGTDTGYRSKFIIRNLK